MEILMVGVYSNVGTYYYQILFLPYFNKYQAHAWMLNFKEKTKLLKNFFLNSAGSLVN